MSLTQENAQKTILCCDDERLLCDLIAEELEFQGYKTLKAYSGNQAIKLLANNSVDVVLTDVRMPDGNGFELLKSIRSRHPSKPVVIFLTGFSDVTNEEAFHEGVDAVLTKPVDFSELHNVVSSKTSAPTKRYHRSHDRFDVNFLASFEPASLNDAIQARLLNIGRGGCFLQIQSRLPEVGERVHFTLNFGSNQEQSFVGTGICRWRRTVASNGYPCGVGLEFVSLDERSLLEFLELIKHDIKKSSIPRL